MHILEKLTTKSVHDAQVEINKWYGSSPVSRTIIYHYQIKLEKLRLDDETEVSMYVNSSIFYSQKFESKNEGYTKDTKRSCFPGQITNLDYDVAKQKLVGDMTKDFDYCVT